MTTFDVEPRINGDIHFGHSLRTSVILAGRVAEKGVGGNVFFDGSERHKGELLPVRITRATGITLYGDPAIHNL